MAREEKEKKRKYYPTDEDKLQKKLAEIGSGDFFKPKEGKNTVRILPPWSKEGVWYKETVMHYGFKTEGGKEKGFACLKMFDKDCPICDKVESLKQEGAEGKELADRIRPRMKYYANVLDYKTGKVMIWGFSAKTLGTLLSYSADQDYGDISHPEKGFDVIIERTGTGKNDTRYDIRCRPKPSALPDDIDWAEQMNDLDTEVAEEPDEDKLEEALERFGGETKEERSGRRKKDDDEDNKDDEDRTSRRGKKDDDDEDRTSRKGKKDEDDEDEDKKDDDDFEKGDEVSFKHKGKKITGKVIKVDAKAEQATVKDEDGEKYEVDFEDLKKESSDD